MNDLSVYMNELAVALIIMSCKENRVKKELNKKNILLLADDNTRSIMVNDVGLLRVILKNRKQNESYYKNSIDNCNLHNKFKL